MLVFLVTLVLNLEHQTTHFPTPINMVPEKTSCLVILRLSVITKATLLQHFYWLLVNLKVFKHGLLYHDLLNMPHIFKLALTFTITKLKRSNNRKRHEDGNGSVRERKHSFTLRTRNIKCYIAIRQEQYTNMRAKLSKFLNNV